MARQTPASYHPRMIKVLETAIEKVKALPPDSQAIAAELLKQVTGAAPQPMSPAKWAAVSEGLAEIDRGDRADPAAVRAVFDKYRL